MWVELPRPGSAGRVQSGRRPAVVLHSSDSLNQVPVVIVVPGTSKRAALRFQHTVLVRPTAANGLSMDTVFIGFQVQS
ncbi:MAG: type II toxin-antitoxin system PemK/MazF family toxin, partial [Gemmatimonadaceae bacterium]